MSKKVFRDSKEVTIDRSKWLRASSNSMLLNTRTDKMCCLGFYAKSCGLPTSCISNVGVPYSANDRLIQKNNRWDSFLLNGNDVYGNGNGYGYPNNSKDAELLMKINDSQETTDSYKEKQITKIFKRNGVKVKFIGK